MTVPPPPPQLSSDKCISIIGMAGCGKTTVGRLAAKALGWAFVDTDHIIESTYGTVLQNVLDSLSRDAFLDMESELVCSLRLSRTVISTGGSVIYRRRSMEHLAALGPVVLLDISLETVLRRIALNPTRGLVIAPGQSIEDLFREREGLYRRYAALTVKTEGLGLEESVARFLEVLAEKEDA